MIELMVASAILMFLLAGLYLLLTGGMRYYQQARAYRTSQHEALVGIRAVLEELGDSRASSVSIDSTLPQAHRIIFPSGQTYPGDGGPIQFVGGDIQWQKWVCIYLDTADNELHRAELAMAPTTAPPAAPGFAAFPMAGNDNRILARGIIELGCTRTSQVLQIVIKSRESVGSNKHTEVTLRSKVFLQN
jgi:hypothetical protein